MKPQLIQSQTQKMILSPQVRLYLKILQMPLQELRQSLLDELEQNPILEELTDTQVPSSTSTEENLEEGLKALDKSEDRPLVDDVYAPLVDPRELTRRKDYQEGILTQSESLSEHIKVQLPLLSLSKSESKWAKEFIGGLDENGFLNEDLSALTQRLQVPEYRLDKLLKKLQTLEPAGIFARSLEESLAIQLETKTHPDGMVEDRVDVEVQVRVIANRR